MKRYISINPHVLGGKPVIAGTRIPVARIIHLLKEGFTVDNISEQYPHIDRKVLDSAIDELIANLDRDTHASQIS